MCDISKLYEELFNSMNDSFQYNRSKVTLKDLSHFVAMKGNLYDTSDVRLLVIGRATNGWDSLNCESASQFGIEANHRFTSKGFDWIENIDDDFNDLHNKPPKGQKTYYLSRSAFWRVIFNIWRNLTGSKEEQFLRHIAWSNLYKVAPKTSGNPTKKMCDKQFNACKEILDAEIRSYKPTHILIVSDYDRWFAPDSGCDFSEIFKDTTRIGSNYSDKNIYIEGTAKFDLDGEMIPVVITCRPEGRNKEKFTEVVVEIFNDVIK